MSMMITREFRLGPADGDVWPLPGEWEYVDLIFDWKHGMVDWGLSFKLSEMLNDLRRGDKVVGRLEVDPDRLKPGNCVRHRYTVCEDGALHHVGVVGLDGFLKEGSTRAEE